MTESDITGHAWRIGEPWDFCTNEGCEAQRPWVDLPGEDDAMRPCPVWRIQTEVQQLLEPTSSTPDGAA